MNNWTVNNIPDQHGRVALVTGANSGLGLETTRALAAHGAHVIMATRNPDKGRREEAEIKQTVPGASIEFVLLDLASLASVREMAAHVSERTIALICCSIMQVLWLFRVRKRRMVLRCSLARIIWDILR